LFQLIRPPQADHPCNVWWEAQILKLFIMHLFPSSLYLLSLWSKYSSFQRLIMFLFIFVPKVFCLGPYCGFVKWWNGVFWEVFIFV
jgi:hypothetical protein